MWWVGVIAIRWSFEISLFTSEFHVTFLWARVQEELGLQVANDLDKPSLSLMAIKSVRKIAEARAAGILDEAVEKELEPHADLLAEEQYGQCVSKDEQQQHQALLEQIEAHKKAIKEARKVLKGSVALPKAKSAWAETFKNF